VQLNYLKYLHDNDLVRSKHVVEVTVVKESGNIVHQVSMSAERIYTFSTAPLE
jgi:hypothetical protein